MNRLFLSLLVTAVFAACNSNGSEKQKNERTGRARQPEPMIEDSVRIDTMKVPVFFSNTVVNEEQQSFQSWPSNKLVAKIFPNNGRRKETGKNTISGVLGVAHFFLDFDLTSGFVHPSTKKFYDILRPDDYLMKFDRLPEDSSLGYVYYVKRKELNDSDKLGKNVAYFRQWKLSEIDYRMVKDVMEIKMKPCTFANGCTCPQKKPATSNPLPSAEIPIWSKGTQDYYAFAGEFNDLDNLNGGTVVIIWYDWQTRSTLFMDLHGSLNYIMHRTNSIAAQYETDPTIAISDAGPMARKFKAEIGRASCR